MGFIMKNKAGWIVFVLIWMTGVSKAQTHYDVQAQRALKYLLENLNSKEVLPGAVMASPSKENPNYFFHWVRDAAVTMRIFVLYLESDATSMHEKKNAYDLLLRWIQFENQIVNLSAPSDLGEPKYELSGNVFWGPWGRPQTDGPALRLSTVSRFAKYVLKNGDPLILNAFVFCDKCVFYKDNQYILNHWKDSSFDVWEEVKGDHFYTRMSQSRGLMDAAQVFYLLNQESLAQKNEKELFYVNESLEYFKDPDRFIFRPTIHQVDGWTHKVSHLDVAVLLGILHSSYVGDNLSVINPWVQNSVSQLEYAFQNLYGLNQNVVMSAPAIGRYPEDVYDGVSTEGNGNPWFIGTHALAEYHCLLGNQQRGLEYLDRSIYHAARDGHMSEQYHREHGFMQGARDLTWSYASYLSAYFACTKSLPKLD